MKKNYLMVILLSVLGVLGFTSCDDDEIAMSALTWTVDMPEGLADMKVEEMDVVLADVNTKAEYTGSLAGQISKSVPETVKVTFEDGEVKVAAIVPEGLYNLSAEGKVSYKEASGKTMAASVRAVKQGVTVSGVESKITEEKAGIYTPSAGFVIEEIFTSGRMTADGKKYNGDQYIKIYNNSDEVLYADGLAVLESAFLTQSKKTYTPDLMSQCFSAWTVYLIPGSGKDHPVNPGETLLLARDGINHQEADKDAFDLTGADFEFYDGKSTSPKNQDVDSEVENMEKWYSYSPTITVFTVQGNRTYCLAKIPTGKETFLKDNYYEPQYGVSSSGKPMVTKCYYIPNDWIIDAVNMCPKAKHQWNLVAPSLDKGFTSCEDSYSGLAVRRKVASEKDGRKFLQDTNDSSVDFESDAEPSLAK